MTSLFSNTAARPLVYSRFLGLKKDREEDIARSASAFGAVLSVWSQPDDGQPKKSQLDGAWELAGAQQLSKGARDIKIISGADFIVATYDIGDDVKFTIDVEIEKQ